MHAALWVVSRSHEARMGLRARLMGRAFRVVFLDDLDAVWFLDRSCFLGLVLADAIPHEPIHRARFAASRVPWVAAAPAGVELHPDQAANLVAFDDFVWLADDGQDRLDHVIERARERHRGSGVRPGPTRGGPGSLPAHVAAMPVWFRDGPPEGSRAP
ncbi:MAG: hypothetical protein AAF602_09595 [Myxococcota bacterium]